MIEYRLCRPEERSRVLAFINNRAYLAHQCTPPETRGEIMVAWDGDEVVGTVSLDYSADDRPFPIECVHSLMFLEASCPWFTRRISVQTGRWFVARKGVSRELIIQCARHVYPRGISWFIFEGKDHTFRVLDRYGFRYLVVADGKPIDVSKMPQKHRKYYEDEPKPKIVLVDIGFVLSVSG